MGLGFLRVIRYRLGQVLFGLNRLPVPSENFSDDTGAFHRDCKGMPLAQMVRAWIVGPIGFHHRDSGEVEVAGSLRATFGNSLNQLRRLADASPMNALIVSRDDIRVDSDLGENIRQQFDWRWVVVIVHHRGTDIERRSGCLCCFPHPPNQVQSILALHAFGVEGKWLGGEPPSCHRESAPVQRVFCAG